MSERIENVDVINYNQNGTERDKTGYLGGAACIQVDGASVNWWDIASFKNQQLVPGITQVELSKEQTEVRIINGEDGLGGTLLIKLRLFLFANAEERRERKSPLASFAGAVSEVVHNQQHFSAYKMKENDGYAFQSEDQPGGTEQQRNLPDTIKFGTQKPKQPRMSRPGGAGSPRKNAGRAQTEAARGGRSQSIQNRLNQLPLSTISSSSPAQAVYNNVHKVQATITRNGNLAAERKSIQPNTPTNSPTTPNAQKRPRQEPPWTPSQMANNDLITYTKKLKTKENNSNVYDLDEVITPKKEKEDNEDDDDALLRHGINENQFYQQNPTKTREEAIRDSLIAKTITTTKTAPSSTMNSNSNSKPKPTVVTAHPSSTMLRDTRFSQYISSYFFNTGYSNSRSTEKSDGFRNLGNTCYLNAVLQALLNLTSFVNDLEQPRLVSILKSVQDSQSQSQSQQTKSKQPTTTTTTSNAQTLNNDDSITDSQYIEAVEKMEKKQKEEEEECKEKTKTSTSTNGIFIKDEVLQSSQVAEGKTEELMDTTIPDTEKEKEVVVVEVQQKNKETNKKKKSIGIGFYRSLVELSELKQKDHGVMNPVGVKAALGKFMPQFQSFQQQDAHEFLLCSLSHLEEELDPYIKGEEIDVEDGKKDPRAKSLCPISRNFRSVVEHTLKCTQCGDVSCSFESFNVFSIDITRNSSLCPPSMSDLLADFFKTDKVERKCEKCGCNEATHEHKICVVPRILILHLKRFIPTSTGYIKSTSKVSVATSLDISNFLSEDAKDPVPYEETNNKQQLQLTPPSGTSEEEEELKRAIQASLQDQTSTKKQDQEEQEDKEYKDALKQSVRGNYRLRCAVWHSGALASSGHYVSCIRDDKKDTWIRFNDALSEQIPKNDYATRDSTQGYIYFFQHTSVFDAIH